MKFRHLKKIDFNTIKWSGGTSTELFIYPQDSEFANRNFIFRISTATVAVDSSVFTNLPGYKRTLMVLDGEMILNHDDHHKVTLNKFEKDTFLGDWKTTSFGKCMDFNLIAIPSLKSELDGFKIEQGDGLNLELNELYEFILIFVFKGNVDLDKELSIKEGEVMVIHEVEKQNLHLNALNSSAVVVVKIMK